jgi:hypothetical protein
MDDYDYSIDVEDLFDASQKKTKRRGKRQVNYINDEDVALV